ncbi:hypothetical protein F4774DRAFT_388734 [Daldinia eschscholtzii]|nr:hypothetical protein F4774DRAFT_388734 [Daldinia eschscholtzii]
MECSITIIVSCAPAIYSLWSNYVATSRSARNPVSSYMGQSERTNISGPPQQIRVVTQHYIELSDHTRSVLGYQANAVSTGGKG